MKAEIYERFEVIDEIGKYFHVKSVDDIKVSIGSVRLEEDKNGTEKVIWTITKEDGFKTGNSISMEIKVEFKGELNSDVVYPTNKNAEVRYKLPEEEGYSHTIDSTPQLRAGYYVTYDPNLPKECNPSGEDLTEKRPYFAYDKADKSYGNYSCPGWQLKEWKIDEIVPGEGKDKFPLPSHDIRVAAIWTKTELTKNMEGTVYEPVQELFMAMKENEGISIPVDTGINFSEASSETNGRGLYVRSGTERDANPIYYYRGAVENNHVLFAGICWQIVRTTETGGIKLIYNGVSNDGKTCNNPGDTHIGESAFNGNTDNVNSPSSIGYMYGNIYHISSGTFNTNTSNSQPHVFGKSVIYDKTTREYSLVNTKLMQIHEDSVEYPYNCWNSNTVCSNIVYILDVLDAYNTSGDFVSTRVEYLELTGGDTLETAKQKMFANTRNSTVKTKIDSWYRRNIENKGYTKYLDQDTVWCNDRTITSGGLMSEDAPYGSTVFSDLWTRKRENNLAVKDSDACPNVRDRFTIKSSNVGNKVLTYPVGILTADEVVLGGIYYGYSDNASDSYLVTGYDYWTMTPSQEDGIDNVHYNYFVSRRSISDALGDLGVGEKHYVRPSISLKLGTLVNIDSDGTREHPYTVIVE